MNFNCKNDKIFLSIGTNKFATTMNEGGLVISCWVFIFLVWRGCDVEGSGIDSKPYLDLLGNQLIIDYLINRIASFQVELLLPGCHFKDNYLKLPPLDDAGRNRTTTSSTCCRLEMKKGWRIGRMIWTIGQYFWAMNTCLGGRCSSYDMMNTGYFFLER